MKNNLKACNTRKVESVRMPKSSRDKDKKQSERSLYLEKIIAESPFSFDVNGVKPCFGPAVGSIPCSSSVSDNLGR